MPQEVGREGDGKLEGHPDAEDVTTSSSGREEAKAPAEGEETSLWVVLEEARCPAVAQEWVYNRKAAALKPEPSKSCALLFGKNLPYDVACMFKVSFYFFEHMIEEGTVWGGGKEG